MHTEETINETKESLQPSISFQALLAAGAHFGHKTAQWNPKMAYFIYGARNGVHIFDLNLTLVQWEKAEKFLYNLTSQGKNILFVGTKKQAQTAIKEHALRGDCFYIDYRWPPGLLTNIATLRKSVDKLKKLQLILSEHESGIRNDLTKRELLLIQTEVAGLEKELGGVVNMKHLPDALFIVDVEKDSIAVSEALKLNIPIVAICDTNVNPTDINYPIPANDDAISTIKLIVSNATDIILQGKEFYKKQNISSNEEQEVNEIIQELNLPPEKINIKKNNIEVTYK